MGPPYRTHQSYDSCARCLSRRDLQLECEMPSFSSIKVDVRGVFRGGRTAPPPKLSKGIMHARENH